MLSIIDSRSRKFSRETEILELAAHIDAATCRFLTLIREHEESGDWRGVGMKSCAHWLAWKCGLTTATARERMRVARALGGLPKVAQALSKGLLSYSKVRAMTRVATPENEEKLVHTAKAATAAQLERICRGVAAAMNEGGVVTEAERWVVQKRGDGGLVRIEAQLHPDEAALIMKALDAMRFQPSPGGDASIVTDGDGATVDVRVGVSAEPSAQARAPRLTCADALVKLADLALSRPVDAAEPRRTGGDRATLFVHVTDNDLTGTRTAELDDGTRLPAETFRRIACDVGVVPVLTDDVGKPLDVGRKTRSISPALRRALVVRDRTCSFPGCDHTRWLDAHHVEHWLHGGETKIDNLILICPAHHRLIHEGGFSVARTFGRGARFSDPDGRAIALAPQKPVVAQDALINLRAANENAGAVIDEHTSESEWCGERADYDYMVARLM
ncbi:MAG: hypothetical protein DRJ42_31035 [Deltaproteobacteria bacterium]|nr:MAG: hypothetical protein DRJ42_31035 [Deltaproteobacteria bacterium]